MFHKPNRQDATDRPNSGIDPFLTATTWVNSRIDTFHFLSKGSFIPLCVILWVLPPDASLLRG